MYVFRVLLLLLYNNIRRAPALRAAALRLYALVGKASHRGPPVAFHPETKQTMLAYRLYNLQYRYSNILARLFNMSRGPPGR